MINFRRAAWSLAILLAAALQIAAAPASRRAPAADPGAIAPAAWPARHVVQGHPDARGVIRTLDIPGLVGFQPGIGLLIKPSQADLADARALIPGDGDAQEPMVAFEQPGSFVFRATTRPGKPPHAELWFVFVSARPSDAEPPAPRIERTWFGYYAPAEGVDPRGLALLMPGMFGTPEPILNLFISRLTAQGWGVVRMMAQPSRFTQKTVFKVDTADPAAAAGSIAAEFDQRSAECAFAVQAAMEFVARERPALAPLPRIAVGMSGGAMTMPTVLALEPERYAAAVMIAGGCNYLAINEESNYRMLIDAISLQWSPGAPTDDDRARLDSLYLERSRLDSYHAAAALAGKPMLMIHGDHDGAVPARLGDMLWERLGKPERWVQVAGHEEVFMKLPAEMDKIMEWIAAAVPAGAAPAPSPE